MGEAMISFKMFDPQYEPEIVSDMWEDIRDKVERTLRFWDGAATIVDVERSVAAGMIRIISIHWSVANVGVMLVEPKCYPQYRNLNIVYFQSSCFEELIPNMIKPFQHFVVDVAGFKGIEALCRPGIARLLRKHGLKSKLVQVNWNG